MKRNIKDYIGTKTVIWIDAHTIEQENAIKDLLIADGRITRWAGGSEKLNEYNVCDKWNGIEYCACIDSDTLHILSKVHAESRNYQIIPASEFLQPKFEYLEEIEVSDFKEFPIGNSRIKPFIGMHPNGSFVVAGDGYASTYKYARKINHERTEAISTIKSLMQKFNISKDEI